jgi:hypothetical protein
MKTTTLKELAARLNSIIAENEARGWSERNDLPVVIEVSPLPRQPRQHFKSAKMYYVDYASSAMTGFTDAAGKRKQAMVINTSESYNARAI